MTHHTVRSALALALATTALSPAIAQSTDWSTTIPAFRVGILGGENEADRLKEWSCFQELVQTELGVPVELYPASDYAGVMQGLLADQLEYAQLGASAYAGIHLQDPEAVEPIVTNSEADGSLGYYAMMYARADSGITSLEQMEGKSLAFADPNSTSGYLVPNAELKLQGIDPEIYFSQTGFGGGHEQAVVAVLQGQYDGGVTWTSGIGEKAEGFSRGNLRSMVEKGMLDMEELNIIWQSSLIPNGPVVMRNDLPAELKDQVKAMLVGMAESDPECFSAVSAGEGGAFVPIEADFYDGVIEMRRMEQEAAR